MLHQVTLEEFRAEPTLKFKKKRRRCTVCTHYARIIRCAENAWQNAQGALTQKFSVGASEKFKSYLGEQ